MSEVRASSNWWDRCIMVQNIYNRLTSLYLFDTPPNEFVNTSFRNIFFNWQDYSQAQNAPYVLKHQSELSLYEKQIRDTLTISVEEIKIIFCIIKHSKYIKNIGRRFVCNIKIYRRGSGVSRKEICLIDLS